MASPFQQAWDLLKNVSSADDYGDVATSLEEPLPPLRASRPPIRPDVLERAKNPTEVPPEPNPDLTEEIYNRETYQPPRSHQPLLPPAPDNRLRDAMAEAQSRPLPPPLNIERVPEY